MRRGVKTTPAFWIAVAAIAAGAAFRIHVITLPLDVLASRYLADDYFYYLGAAEHIARGAGSTVDGLTRTNGYQPLFLWCLVLVFKTGATHLGALYLGLWLQMAAAVAAAFGLFRWCDYRGKPWAGALAAGVTSLNLFFVLPTLTGFELALALACVIWALVCWQEKAPPLLTGVASGLAVLARVDAAVLVVLLSIGFAARRQWPALVRHLAAVLIVVGPWMIWSATHFGSVSPDSGVIKAHVRGLHAAAASMTTAFHAIPRLAIPGALVDALSRGPRAWILPWSTALLLAAAVWQTWRSANWMLAALAAAVAASYVTLIDPHEGGALVRYLYPVWAIVVLLASEHAVLRWPPVVVLVLGLHAWDAASYVNWERRAPVPQTFVGAAATVMPQAIARVVPARQPLAAFDSGALGYFSPSPVVNLDGLANHDIVELQRTCRTRYAECLMAYLHGRDIRVLAGGTAFGWTQLFPDWPQWERLFESAPLADGSRIVLLRIP